MLFRLNSNKDISLSTLIFSVFQYPLGFSVYETDQIMKLINEWFPTGKFIKVDTNFRIESTYKKDIMYVLPLTVNVLCK